MISRSGIFDAYKINLFAAVTKHKKSPPHAKIAGETLDV